MMFPNRYKVLERRKFQTGPFTLVPIRYQDRLPIMQWRNEQLYHLRQQKPLTETDQEQYFTTTVAQLFEQEQPNQLLFSFLEKEVCIGYGGLVHINWVDKNAEISFIMNTSLEAERFHEIWTAYLYLLEQVAFVELQFHKIYTYAFDLRPHLYETLLTSRFYEEARLKEHCFFENKFLDVVIHSKFNTTLTFRRPTEADLMLYFDWANDSSVRSNSYDSAPINLKQHSDWFYSKLKDKDCSFFLFENHFGFPVGQVRIQKISKVAAVIGISNDKLFRGKGYASMMLKMATDIYLKEHPKVSISAYIKIENTASIKVFEKAGYLLKEVLEYNSFPSFHYIKKL